MSTDQPSYVTPKRQVMLSLAYLAYCGDEITSSRPNGVIGSLITNGIARIPVLCTTSNGVSAPDWAAVWGPVAYTVPGALYQDGLMYVARSETDPTRFVVAIRGTNHVSDLDWLMDDFDVLQQMPWPPGSTETYPTVLISESTSVALQALLNMTDANGEGLLAFLKTQSSSAIDLTVTGHSLGGCLASALGLYLTGNHGEWDAIGGSTVSCVTFAAPTAGNTCFADLFAEAFPADSFDRVQCSLDIVPLAWTAANVFDTSSGVSAILDIYDNDEGFFNEEGVDFRKMSFVDSEGWKYIVIGSLLPTLRGILSPLDYAQPFPDAQLLPGQQNFESGYTVYDEDFAVTSAAFAAQAAYQHSVSYPTLLQVPELLDPTIIVNRLIGKSTEQVRRPKGRALRQLLAAAFDGPRRARLAGKGQGDGDKAASSS